MLRNVSSSFGPVEHFDVLVELARSLAAKRLDEHRIDAARRALIKAVGEEGFVDACGVIGMFIAVTKVVDLTGHKSPLALKAALHVSGGLVAVRKNAVSLALLAMVLLLLLALLR